jgi:glycosyltransferase involved in cell wall biosynthesis
MENNGVSVQAPEGFALTVSDLTEAYGIVALSHLRWNFVWQRPQQFLSRFASDHPILFFEEPDFCLPEGSSPTLKVDRVSENITVACPQFAHDARGHADLHATLRGFLRDAIDQVNDDGLFDRPLLWYYSPMEAAWSLDHVESRGVVYDCMDELSQFRGAPKELVDEERRLIARADIVFTGGYELWLKKSQQHPNTHFFGCGVEYDHFAKAQADATEVPGDIANLPRPIVGWFGVVDERVDYDLLREMAAMRPDWSFVMVGPVVKVDPASLPQAPNLHWLSGRDYKELPKYCKGFDVCMMAFAINEATEFINPTKALEYLATGKPVISTPVADVVRQYKDLVYLESDAQGFISRIERLIADPEPDRIQRGIDKAADCSWESTVSQMRALIQSAIADDSESTLPDAEARPLTT